MTIKPAATASPAASPLKPVPKVAAAGTAGVAATVIIIVAQMAKVDIPPEVAAGVVAIVTFAIGWWKKDHTKPAAPAA